jgi:hypothetical protein
MKPRMILPPMALVGFAIAAAAALAQAALAQDVGKPQASAAAAQPGQRQLMGTPGKASPSFTVTHTPQTGAAQGDLPQTPRVDNKMIR